MVRTCSKYSFVACRYSPDFVSLPFALDALVPALVSLVLAALALVLAFVSLGFAALSLVLALSATSEVLALSEARAD